MAQLDPNIILRGFNPPPLEDPLENAAKAYTLKSQIMQAQNQERQFRMQDSYRKDVEALGPNPTPEQMVGVATKYAGPSEQLKYVQSSLDRKAQMEATAQQRAATLAQQAQNNSMIHESRMARLTNDTDRAAETARHNRAQESIAQQTQVMNAELRRMGLGIQAQGLQLRQDMIENKKNIAQVQDTSAASNITANMDRLSQEANRLLRHPGLSKTTGIMSIVPLAGGLATVPGTDAANFKAGLETLKSQAGFSVLQAMREASKTGGALGQVSDFENRMLQANLAALDTAQSEPEFKAALKKIIEYTDQAKGRINRTLRDKYSAQQSPPTTSTPQGGLTPEEQRELEALRKRFGK